MDEVVRLAEHGLIHGDFNEFNILVDDEGVNITVIDFPQMISTSHENAAELFARDIQCLNDFFQKKFHVETLATIKLEDVEKKLTLDISLQETFLI